MEEVEQDIEMEESMEWFRVAGDVLAFKKGCIGEFRCRGVEFLRDGVTALAEESIQSQAAFGEGFLLRQTVLEDNDERGGLLDDFLDFGMELGHLPLLVLIVLKLE